MSFSPFAILTAEEMNNILENINSLADGSGFDTGAIGTEDIANLAVTNGKIDFSGFSGSTTQWRSWIPTLTNFTGTVNVARYTLIGGFCFFYLKVTQGGSVTGNHVFSLPVPVNANQAFITPINPINTSGYVQDLGVAQFPAHVQLLTNTTCGLLVTSAAGAYTSPTATSPTIPMIWASGQDSFHISGWYEV